MNDGYQRPRAVLFDVNGTLMWGDEPIPGTPEAIAALSRRLRVCYFSNDPRGGGPALAERLRQAGFVVEPDAVQSALHLAAAHVGARYAGQRVLVVGGVSFRELLRAHGVEVVDEPPAAAVVAAGAARFSPEALNAACQAIWQHDAAFLATSLDRRLPGGRGRFWPGTGAVARAIAWATGREPEVLGKPSALAAEAACQLLGVPPAAGVVVGDSPGTDVRLGRRIGARTALVLTGVVAPADVARLAPEAQPDVVLPAADQALVDWIESL